MVQVAKTFFLPDKIFFYPYNGCILKDMWKGKENVIKLVVGGRTKLLYLVNGKHSFHKSSPSESEYTFQEVLQYI